MTLTSNRYPESGFSLFEVLVALVIISIVFTAVLQMHGSTIQMEFRASFYLKAPELARSKMNELTLNTTDLTGGSGDFGEDHPGYIWEASVEDVVSVELGESSDRLKKVDLKVTREGGLSYDLRQYVFIK